MTQITNNIFQITDRSRPSYLMYVVIVHGREDGYFWKLSDAEAYARA